MPSLPGHPREEAPLRLYELHAVFVGAFFEFFARGDDLFVGRVRMVVVRADFAREGFEVSDVVFAVGVEERADMVARHVFGGVFVYLPAAFEVCVASVQIVYPLGLAQQLFVSTRAC